ncbi:LytR family transcriptional regulator [Streptomyces sp. CNQ-509]|uniref:LCP family protein n=1 Tax=unclassified Streptomyces TaxID=2593676 RepID=UPI00062DF603|nr:LCP family protein [Streptomyces sp. CNQ-509]AKH82743.1 LytR family transcriptional regulator [Streptomyces sp. CNQ-509]
MGADETGPREGASPYQADPPPPRRPRPRSRRRVLARRVGLGLAVFLLALSGVGWYFYQRFDSNITVDSATARELKRYEAERPAPAAGGATNILVLGSDSRAGSERYGHDTGVERSDTAVLLHLAGDRDGVTAVSIPRDLMVKIPDCRRPGGGTSGKQVNQFNFSFAYGGAACTIRVVEKLVGVRVDHHVIADFQGFKEVVDAVDGVEVCLPAAMHDRSAKLRLPKGRQVLDGEQALGYVRARKSLDGGGDTQRMSRQQEFMASLVNKVQSNGVLFNPLRLAPLLDAVTSALTANEELSSLTELYDLVRVVRDVPQERVHFMTVPRRPYRLDSNRDELAQPAARELFGALRTDSVVRFVSEGRKAKQKRDSGAPPVYKGTTPVDDICR